MNKPKEILERQSRFLRSSIPASLGRHVGG